ncbi:GTP-binding protein [Methylobacterium platani]|uniref:GTP-binding protein n=1 Tax=Methylobacterium platani TaxID=427683 RepID=UPI0007DC0713
MIRAKGHFWIASRPDWIGALSIAGQITRTEGLGSWWAAVPKARWPTSEEFASLMRRHWSPSWGNRRQEIVFIGGPDMDEGGDPLRPQSLSCRQRHDGADEGAEVARRSVPGLGIVSGGR